MLKGSQMFTLSLPLLMVHEGRCWFKKTWYEIFQNNEDFFFFFGETQWIQNPADAIDECGKRQRENFSAPLEKGIFDIVNRTTFFYGA